MEYVFLALAIAGGVFLGGFALLFVLSLSTVYLESETRWF